MSHPVSVIDLIGSVFKTDPAEIKDITLLKKGMTNRSFLFTIGGKKRFSIRIPGEGTDRLINRYEEAAVYQVIRGRGICDDPVYLDPGTGIKITPYLEGVRSCDPHREEDIVRSLHKLKALHQLRLNVDHSFDLFEKIHFYQDLWKETASYYPDHSLTTDHVMELRSFIDAQPKESCLTHIDAVQDNFLFYRVPGEKEEGLQLTDWEYAGMQDPHLDLAMFSIYAFYDKAETDHLIDLYFNGSCPYDTRTKIYCYMAAAGLLWSNWCEYKAQLGVKFGEYALRQYDYARDFYRYAQERIKG